MPSPLPTRIRMLPPLALLLAAALAASARADEPEGRWFTEKPEFAPTQEPGRAATSTPTAPRAGAGREELGRGPAPVWIWGAEDRHRYFLRKEFAGGTKDAWLKAAGDDRMTVYLNGKQVASADRWDEPVVLDVQAYLHEGPNELIVEAANEGGQAGFALKLALIGADGRARHVVTDATWTAAERRDAKEWARVRTEGEMGVGPWGDVFAKAGTAPEATRGVFQVRPGFRVEKIFTVPRETLGSWVAITFDDKGRLIASDQGEKGLCRITPAPIGSDQPTKVERLDVKITSAQGLLYAFDSLYLSVNGGPGSGLYRARDTDGDDRYDEVVKLKEIRGASEHGPHALRLTPDGKSILMVAGNHTLPPDPLDASRLPSNWGEDLLLPRQWDANGHARGILAPGGWIAKTDPDGKRWEVISSGYRNAYDIAFNAEGELFAYDSDMEWDFGMPWYRPTRAVHAASGSEFGWRSGTGKWPAYYPDSLPPMVDIGPGSPVGIAFGYGAKFPARYQKALFLCDWTFGTIYALDVEPSGATYSARKEEFLSRTPLPLTDIAIGPDGALYFTIGGRGTHSELYRVTYAGDESTAPADLQEPRMAELRKLRRRIEQFHRRADDPAQAVAFLLPYLGHEDRFIRYAARVGIENQPATLWQDRVLAEQDPEALINGAVALARQGDRSLQPRLLAAFDRIDFATLNELQQLELLRAWSLAFIRMGEPDPGTAARLAKKLDAYFPAKTDARNRELASLLVYLKSPTIISKLVGLLNQETERSEADVPEFLARNPGYGNTFAAMLRNRPDAQKIHYAFVLRNLKEGWTLAQRKSYFDFLQRARNWSGGASYQGFINNIDKEAFENASEAERLAIEASGARKPYQVKELPKPQGPGRAWTLDEVLSAARPPLADRDFARGQRTFAAARCILCHRFGGEGGATGPDLTQAAGRFSLRDLAESIVEPNRVVSDQYRASIIATSSGQVYTGRIVGDAKDRISILVDPQDSTKVVEVARSEIDETTPSKVSMMPEKLLDTLNEDEVRDLLAYLLSRGDPNDPMFKKPTAGAGRRAAARKGQ